MSSSRCGTEQPSHLIKTICSQSFIIPHKSGIEQLTSLGTGKIKYGQNFSDKREAEVFAGIVALIFFPGSCASTAQESDAMVNIKGVTPHWATN